MMRHLYGTKAKCETVESYLGLLSHGNSKKLISRIELFRDQLSSQNSV